MSDLERRLRDGLGASPEPKAGITRAARQALAESRSRPRRRVALGACVAAAASLAIAGSIAAWRLTGPDSPEVRIELGVADGPTAVDRPCLDGAVARMRGVCGLPPLDLKAVGGEFIPPLYLRNRLTTADLQGRVVVIGFTGSWCQPCAGLREAVREIAGGSPAAPVLVTVDDGLQDAFVVGANSGVAVVLGPKGMPQRVFGIVGAPEIVVLDRRGGVAARLRGPASDDDVEELTAIVAGLVRDPPPEAARPKRTASGFAVTGEPSLAPSDAPGLDPLGPCDVDTASMWRVARSDSGRTLYLALGLNGHASGVVADATGKVAARACSPQRYLPATTRSAILTVGEQTTEGGYLAAVVPDGFTSAIIDGGRPLPIERNGLVVEWKGIAPPSIRLTGSLVAAREIGLPPQAPPERRFEFSGAILEGGGHGPQICAAVRSSLPPQCGGPDLVGLDWSDIPQRETSDGVTWVDRVRVVGTWDGTRLTLTEPPTTSAPTSPPVGSNEDILARFKAPCDAPPGGWSPIDLSTTTDAAFEKASALARRWPDHAGSWVDQSINPALPFDDEDRAKGLENNPRWMIMVVKVTGDVAARERELRTLWGGSLCVVKATTPLEKLTAIQADLHRTIPGMLGSGPDETRGVLRVDVWFDDGTLQRRLDRQYGPGAVEVTSALRPVPSSGAPDASP